MEIKRLLFVLIAVLLGLSLYFNLKQFNTSRDDANRIEILAKNASKQSAIISRYIAPDKTKHVVYTTVYVKSDAEKELAISPGYVDSLKKALNIKASQIEAFLRVKGTATGTVKTQSKIDSIGNKTFSYDGKYLGFSFNPADSLVNYQYKIELVNTRYYKGNWLFGKRYYNDIFFADKNANIDGVNHFTIAPERRKRFGVGLQIGYYFDPQTRQFSPAFGAGLSYNLINF